ncbi:MAG: peptidase E [Chitinophagaceae bacterium]|nr:peptidase E [Chitinophagaceae bacterium]
MKHAVLILIIGLFFALSASGQNNAKPEPDKTIFVYGGNFNPPFIGYVASLTKKTNPKICFIPTASADDPYMINAWYEMSAGQAFTPFVLRTFINSYPGQASFEETLLDMDAIIVGGGSTLNMLAIWRAQGIDTVLKKAYDRGIVLAGGSAGSLCWFTGGYSDSRPKELTIIKGLGFLNFSHSPHYHGEPGRRELYQNAILSGKLQPGYACDDLAGLLFINGEVKKSVSLNNENKNYFVSAVDGQIKEEALPTEIMK